MGYGAGGQDITVTSKRQGLSVMTEATAGTESKESTICQQRPLYLLDGIIDIYMPDVRWSDSAVAEKYVQAPDYPAVVTEALKEMHRQVGDLQISKDGLAERGLLIRHLLMPEGLAGTRELMHYIATEISPHSYVNIMSQYRPEYRAGSGHGSVLESLYYCPKKGVF
jgi:putative pyruvate formate lyase activating enzyme